MRIGERVQRVIRTTHKIEFFGPIGTVFSITRADDAPERDVITELCVRWDTGKLETLTGEDVWELEDVTPCLFVNVYLHDRAYGGPEEGGWWYDIYEPVAEECAEYTFESVAQAAYDAKVKWAKEENKHRRHPSSVCSEGHYVVRLEAWPAEYSPASRPYYS